MSTWMYILLVPGLLIGSVVLYFIIRGVISATSAASGSSGLKSFLKNFGWLVLGAIVVPVAYYLMTQGMSQTVILLTGIAIAIFAFNNLMKSKSKGWLLPAIVAAALLIMSQTEVWDQLHTSTEDLLIPTPGTTEVTRAQNVGFPTGGEYTLTDYMWLSFDWPVGMCVWIVGVTDPHKVSNAPAEIHSILSRGGTYIVRAKALHPGETWEGYTCG